MANHFIDNFLKNLNASESAVITRYLKNNISNAEESKTFEVFQKLTSGEPVRYENKAALNKIKSRILEKSLDAIILGDEHARKSLCEFDQIQFKLKKQIIQYKQLEKTVNDNNMEVINHLLNEVIRESKKYEMYPLLTEALISKKYLKAIRNNRNEFEILNKEIAFYEICSRALYRVNDNYFRLVSETGASRTLKNTEITKWLSRTIKETEKDFRITKAQQVNYYLHIFRFAFYERKKQYKKAIAECKKLIPLLKKYPAIYKTERVGNTYNNLALFSGHLHDYKNALKYVKAARIHFKPGSLNSIITAEHYFLINFYAGNYTNAEEIINVILENSKTNLGEFRKDKYIYFKSCFSFSQGRYKEALYLLKIPLEIEKDKCDWKIAVSILTILSYIELNKTAEAARTLEALRKYIERNLKDGKIKERDLLIVKALREMEKNSFEYDPKNTALAKIIKQLSAKDTAVSWEHYTAELIPFHEWLGKRINRRNSRSSY